MNTGQSTSKWQGWALSLTICAVIVLLSYAACLNQPAPDLAPPAGEHSVLVQIEP